MYRQQFDEQILDELQRDLVWAVGEGVGGVGVDFHEQAVQSGGHRRAGEDRGELTITAGRAAEAAGALDGVGGVENDRNALFPHQVERAHIDDEVIISEGRAALGDEETVAAEGTHFIGDVHAIQRREELAFFHVHHAAGFRGGLEEIRLAAEEGGDLEEINVLGGDVSLLGGVDIGSDGAFQLLGNFAEDAAALFDARAPEGADRGAVRFVKGGFENEGDAGTIGDLLERARHFPCEFLALKRAGA